LFLPTLGNPTFYFTFIVILDDFQPIIGAVKGLFWHPRQA